MPAMLSIDFGNSFTKVAIRPDADSPAELLKDSSLNLDELNVCVPTLASCRKVKGRELWDYGTDVLQHRESTPGLTVHRNWKPRFFEGANAPSNSSAKSLVPAAGKEAARSFRMSDEQWLVLKKAFGYEDTVREQVESTLLPPPIPPQVVPPTEETDIDTKAIGHGFFAWLKRLVEPICLKQGLGEVKDIPVRISLPSFGAVTRAEMLLCEILDNAGWKPDRHKPALPEPYANAIGAFTEGRNVTHRVKHAGVMPDYPRMLEKTGLLAAILDAIRNNGPQYASVLIVDVGGYTADYSMINLDLEDIDGGLEGTVKHHSEPIGVAMLDQRVLDVLAEANRPPFGTILRDPDQGRLERFHETVYSERKPYRLVKAVLGDKEEHGRIQEVLDAFADEVAEGAESFMERHQLFHIDDLILTGGGCSIPTIRDTLRKRLGPCGVRQTHMYVSPKSPVLIDQCHKLSTRLVRGATALGGASIFFDYAK